MRRLLACHEQRLDHSTWGHWGRRLSHPTDPATAPVAVIDSAGSRPTTGSWSGRPETGRSSNEVAAGSIATKSTGRRDDG